MAESTAGTGRYYCNHCDEKVSKTLYFAHKKLYYNHTTEEWIKSVDCHQEDQPDGDDIDFTFSDSDSGMCSIYCKYIDYSNFIT
jgi:hypothetical protein